MKSWGLLRVSTKNGLDPSGPVLGEIASSSFPAKSQKLIYNGGTPYLYQRVQGMEYHPEDPWFPNTGDEFELAPGTADFDMDMPQAWAITKGSPDVIVGVVDTGFYLDHLALTGQSAAVTDPPGINLDQDCPGACGGDEDDDGLEDEDGDGLVVGNEMELLVGEVRENVVVTDVSRQGRSFTLVTDAEWGANAIAGWVMSRYLGPRNVDIPFSIESNSAWNGTSVVVQVAPSPLLDFFDATVVPTHWPFGSVIVADGKDTDGDGVKDDFGFNTAFLADDDENGYIDDTYGYDFGDRDNDILHPANDHGTMVAGILLHNDDVGDGIGVAPNVRFVGIKAMPDAEGQCDAENPGVSFTLEMVDYAASRGVSVLNLSFLGNAGHGRVADYAYDTYGIICVGGNGNFQEYDQSFDGSETIIRVAGTDKGRPAERTEDSQGTNYHEEVDISAEYYSATARFDCTGITPQSSTLYSANRKGTSLSTPMVAGVAALMQSAYPHWSHEFVRAKLLASTKPIVYPDAASQETYGGRLGSGMANAYRALTYYDELFPFYDVAEPTTHVVNWRDSVYLSGDLHIPAGQELVIAAGTVVEVGQDDIMETGNITRQIEIKVDGTLTINGTAQNPVIFRMFGDDGLPAGEPTHNPDQTWGGFRPLTSESISGEHVVLEDLAPRSTVVAVPEAILAPGQTQTLVWVDGTPAHAATRIRTSVDGGMTFDAGSPTVMATYNWTATQDMVNKDVVIRVEFLDADLYVTSFEDITPVRVREPFANVSVESNMTIPQGSTPYASAPLDYDEDGLEDFVISYESEQAQLYKNDFDLVTGIRFDPRSSDLGSGSEQDTRGVNRIDVNNDGHIDVFLAANGTTTDSKLFLGDGTDLTAASDPSTFATVNVKAVKSAAWGDFNKDGWLDAYLVRDGAETDILMQADPGSPVTYTDVTSAAGLFTSGTTQTSAAMWVDADLDKDQDLFVCWEGPVSAGPALGWSPFYYNHGPDGSGQYTFVDESKETGSGPNGVGIGRLGELVGVYFADLDSDRKLDILLASKAGPTAPFGNLIVCLNNGYGGMYAEGGTIGIDVPENIVDVEVADLDGNGVPDIIAVPEAATQVRALVGFGDGPNRNYVDASGAYQLGTDLTYGVTTTDIDADSDHDVLLLRPESGTSPSDKKFLWANPLLDAPAPAGQEETLTIGFDPGSLTHNPYGIGAIVAVEVTPPGGSTLYSSQVVDGGSGRGGQGAGRLAFGLAGASTAQITVRWPHGGVQVFDASAMPGFPDVLITDTTDPVIDESTITWSYTPTTGTTVHTFRWWTDGPSDEAQVLVNISSPNNASCRIPLGGDTSELLDGDNPGVGATSVKIGERYRHTVTWSAYCSGRCNYTYKVRNVIGGQVYSASQKTMNVSVCADIIQF